ncbi:tyrosine-type recombinase/integrase [Marivirga arenosa]|uniref:Tyrosine-type recombinase/integrase n=1 Tax=Marivirga arenosa TaxID=3059076 RepID=A0AA49JCH8_9BACT|nr:tyrosine-type recombinase/integrase [Marivirga sp. BKB1-2]WKK80385.2 tyrosine-type recombinase/integrase [Marivirga sp. BKB1-2]WNB17011.1 tyrosine-type recombinase/integrase [Marivirga sp. BKB1-2]WNB17015.1 tyrosine-type recombinase/integrase [Marivirga sp. BKB1-2]WNB17019.1 tyrosine-type recombinase/integrase [Marivirga sp. BKB1-2]
MKKLNLSNASYRYLEESFKEWLAVQGYSITTVYNLPLHVRELLHYLEQQEIKNIRELKTKHIEGYYQKLKERANNRRGGGLSNGHLNKHIQALRKFTEYLRKVGRLEIPAIRLKDEEAVRKLDYLTVEEIRLLFKASYQLPDRKPNASDQLYEAIQSRDRAMLAIYYGCGLRRNEGVQLEVEDINFDSSILHVKGGKNYKERLVPISKRNLHHLISYVYDHRTALSRGSKIGKLFISYSSGKGMQGQSLLLRLKKLQYQTGDLDLIEKEIGLHTLRHSIATHLLTAGMKLESISRFLGHSSLESTQIYAHLQHKPSEQQTVYKNIPVYEYIQLSEDER